MNFLKVNVGDKLHVKLALTKYSIIDISMHTTEVTDTNIVAACGGVEDTKDQKFYFDRLTGIVTGKPKQYSNSVTSWIQRVTAA